MEWLFNVVHVIKKNGKLCICIYFRDLNKATPKDEYLMPISNMLIGAIAQHKVLLFMDGHFRYN